MTHLFFLLFFFVLGVPTQMQSDAPVSDSSAVQQAVTVSSKEKAFAQKLFAALKSNDVKAWLSLFPTGPEYAELLRKMAVQKVQGMTVQMAEEMIAEQAKNGVAAYSKEFDDLRRKAATAGLNWSQASYSNFIFEAGKSPVGNGYLSGDLWLRVGKTEYVIEGVEAIKTGAGYRLQNIAAIKKSDVNE